MPAVFLVIVNYNGTPDLLDCLQSVSKLSKTNFHLTVVVVDNASQNPPKEVVHRQFPSTIYIQNKKNLGFTGGNNVGMSYALENGADYVVILNPDVTVDPLLVESLLRGFIDDGVGITVPKVYFAAGFEFHKDRYKDNEKGKVIWYAGGIMDWDNIIGHHKGVDEVDQGQYDQEEETEYASGNCFMVKREVIEKVGLFDDKYFLYYEDADFSMRVKKAGYSIKYIPAAVLWHKNAQSAGGSGSGLQDYFITRNRLRFGFTYAKLRTKLALMRESFRKLFSPYQTSRQGVIDFYTGSFGKGRYLKN